MSTFTWILLALVCFSPIVALLMGELLRKRAAQQTRPLPPTVVVHVYGQAYSFPVSEREAVNTILRLDRERKNRNEVPA